MGDSRDNLKNGTAFPKGVSGNPGGKPSLTKDLAEAIKINPDVPATPAAARAQWWAVMFKVFSPGPQKPNDHNWTTSARELGARLAPPAQQRKEFDAPPANTTPIDWSAVPLERRKRLLGAMREVRELAAMAEHDGDGATEH